MTRPLLRHAFRVVAVALCATALFALRPHPWLATNRPAPDVTAMHAPAIDVSAMDVSSDARASTAIEGVASAAVAIVALPTHHGAYEATLGSVRFSPRTVGSRFWRRAASRRLQRSAAARASLLGWCESCPLAALFARGALADVASNAIPKSDTPHDAQSSPRAPPAVG